MSETTTTTQPQPQAAVTAYQSPEAQAFELAQRQAKCYAASTLVPKDYQGNLGNCLIAMNMAERTGMDILQVMQNLYVVHGRPAWSSQALIATFNTCGRFTPITYRFTGTKGQDDWGCVAITTDKRTGEVLEGPEVTIGLAKAEGWHGKNGSKWKTMPELMLRYRAAAFLVRTTAPEVSLGITVEEASDIAEPVRRQGVAALDEILGEVVEEKAENA